MNDLAAIARLVDALRPWLPQVVIVGGWAHRLHRYHPLASPPAFLPLLTRDADVALSTAEPLRGNIAAALTAAGFEQEMKILRRPRGTGSATEAASSPSSSLRCTAAGSSAMGHPTRRCGKQASPPRSCGTSIFCWCSHSR